MQELRERVLAEVRKTVIGQTQVVDAMLTAIAVGGHVLLEGVPGVAKTLLARTVAAALGVEFSRIQFTPDMLPSDVTGSVSLRGGELSFQPGPLFAGAVLGDEINRTPPKTQSALLEAMQEGAVTVDGVSHQLPDPFVVLATQNPIEYEGTYPLPEAQLDRFLMKIIVSYPTEAEEVELLKLTRHGLRDSGLAEVTAVADPAELIALRTRVDATSVTDAVLGYTSALVRFTRTLPGVELGASPRAAVHLLAASKATAQLAGRTFVTPDDIGMVAPEVLRHRIILRPEAELDRYTADDAVRAALAAVPVPR
ncbi:MAG: AAA family ATPase [Acidimicrobiia bacterium]